MKQRIAEAFSMTVGQKAPRYALAQRAWSVLAGPVTAALVLSRTTEVEQGYYYAFLSFASFVMFFELGFGNIVVQWLAHSWSSTTQTDGSLGARMQGPETRSLIAIARYWYIGAGLAFVAFAVPAAGWWLNSDSEPWSKWLPAWSLFALGTGANLALAGRVTVAEGLGEIELVYRVRLLASLGGTIALWGALVAGFGYYAIALQQAAVFAVTWTMMRSLQREFLRIATGSFGALLRFWRSKLLPLQWRSALVVGSGFLLYQTSTLIAFRVLGPGEAGRLGFVMSIASMISSLGLMLIGVNAVRLGRLAGAREWKPFSHEFRKQLFVGLGIAVVAIGAADVALVLGERVGIFAADRLAPQSVMAFIFATCLVAIVVQAYTIRARCLKQEPFALENCIAALLWPALAFWTASRFGTLGMAAAYLGLTIAATAIPILLRTWRSEPRWRAGLEAAS